MNRFIKNNLPAIHGIAILIMLSGIHACDKNDSIARSYNLSDDFVYFEHLPIDLDGVSAFEPMGEPNVLPKGHGGFSLEKPLRMPARTAVYAVAYGVIFYAGHGSRSIPEGENQGMTIDDYQLRLQISKHEFVNYAHISEINFDVLPDLKDLPVDERGHDVEIAVQSGDILGWVGPMPALDFSLTDRSLKLNFLNPSRYPEQDTYCADI